MGIPKGITLIVGGGYHGKSTLLNALELGVYNHIQGCLLYTSMAITTTLTAVKCLQEKALWRHIMQMYSFPAQMQSQAMALWSTLMEIPIVSPALPRVQEK